MLDNCTQYFHFELFDHIRWHVIAKSAIQEILNLRPNAKKMPEKENLVDFSARFLKPCTFFCWFVILILPRWGDAKLKYASPFTFSRFTRSCELLPCPIPVTPAHSINIFGCTYSCTGIELLLCLAVSTYSDECPWPLWNFISPAWPFLLCESAIFSML